MVFRFFVEHLSEKKNLAATCIQSTWRLRHCVMENADALILDDWFKSQKLRLLQHKMSENIRRWRVVRRSWSRGKQTKLRWIITTTSSRNNKSASEHRDKKNLTSFQNGQGEVKGGGGYWHGVTCFRLGFYFLKQQRMKEVASNHSTFLATK